MSLKVREVIKELKKFPSEWQVAFESYESENDGYRIYKVKSVNIDEDADKMVLIK
jgi:hypothetical protein